MAKVNVDIEYIKEKLELIGYKINECNQKENNGIVWQIKFYNSDAIVNIYDTNKKNTVINGKPEEGEKEKLKAIVDSLKSKDFFIEDMNNEIVKLIDLKKEGTYWDYKEEWHSQSDNLLHDILCLSNNTENREAYLIIGVANDGTVVGSDHKIKSNDIYDLLKSKKYAGDHMPEIEIKSMYYKYHGIDVLVCKSSKYVPFFLIERSGAVCDYQIYTRVGDTNTAKNRNASYSDMEKLWRVHFERENEE